MTGEGGRLSTGPLGVSMAEKFKEALKLKQQAVSLEIPKVDAGREDTENQEAAPDKAEGERENQGYGYLEGKILVNTGISYPEKGRNTEMNSKRVDELKAKITESVIKAGGLRCFFVEHNGPNNRVQLEAHFYSTDKLPLNSVMVDRGEEFTREEGVREGRTEKLENLRKFLLEPGAGAIREEDIVITEYNSGVAEEETLNELEAAGEISPIRFPHITLADRQQQEEESSALKEALETKNKIHSAALDVLERRYPEQKETGSVTVSVAAAASTLEPELTFVKAERPLKDTLMESDVPEEIVDGGSGEEIRVETNLPDEAKSFASAEPEYALGAEAYLNKQSEEGYGRISRAEARTFERKYKAETIDMLNGRKGAITKTIRGLEKSLRMVKNVLTNPNGYSEKEILSFVSKAYGLRSVKKAKEMVSLAGRNPLELLEDYRVAVEGTSGSEGELGRLEKERGSIGKKVAELSLVAKQEQKKEKQIAVEEASSEQQRAEEKIEEDIDDEPVHNAGTEELALRSKRAVAEPETEKNISSQEKVVKWTNGEQEYLSTVVIPDVTDYIKQYGDPEYWKQQGYSGENIQREIDNAMETLWRDELPVALEVHDMVSKEKIDKAIEYVKSSL